MPVARIGITIDEQLLQEIDEERGMIPRSRFLSKIVADAFATKDGNIKKSDDGDLGRASVNTNRTKPRLDRNDADYD